MRVRGLVRGAGAVGVLALFAAGYGVSEISGVQRSPMDKAKGVNPDTHLVLTFGSAPAIGRSGQIRIYDAANHSLVDTLDMSVPAGPDPAKRLGTPVIDPNPPTPTTTTPAVQSTPTDLHSYQVNTV